jgi:hypothetical protein
MQNRHENNGVMASAFFGTAANRKAMAEIFGILPKEPPSGVTLEEKKELANIVTRKGEENTHESKWSNT